MIKSRERRLAKKISRKSIWKIDISMTPLVDTALTLVIIFIIFLPMTHNGIKLSLPKSKTREGNLSAIDKKVIVSINSSGLIFLNNRPIEKRVLSDAISEIFSNQQDKTVHLMADKTIPYGKVISTIEKIKSGGAINVVMTTRKKALMAQGTNNNRKL